MTLARDWIPSPNWSNRGGTGVRLVVLHTAEGSRTYQSLGSYFSNPAVEASSHVGIDDTPGRIGEYVSADAGAAWTQAYANGYSVAAELCAFAEWDAAEWSRHPTMLDNTAQWLAEECAAFGIPLVSLTADQAQDGHSRGVCDHVDLGQAGGGHWDCGPSFPMDQVIAMAQGGGAPAPTKRKGRSMIASTSTGQGYWTTTEKDGAVYAFGDAKYCGGANDPGADQIQPGQSVVGIAGCGTDGYWLLISDGSVFAYGSAPYKGRADRT